MVCKFEKQSELNLKSLKWHCRCSDYPLLEILSVRRGSKLCFRSILGLSRLRYKWVWIKVITCCWASSFSPSNACIFNSMKRDIVQKNFKHIYFCLKGKLYITVIRLFHVGLYLNHIFHLVNFRLRFKKSLVYLSYYCALNTWY